MREKERTRENYLEARRRTIRELSPDIGPEGTQAISSAVHPSWSYVLVEAPRSSISSDIRIGKAVTHSRKWKIENDIYIFIYKERKIKKKEEN